MRIKDEALIRMVGYFPLFFIPFIVGMVFFMNISALNSTHNITVKNLTKNIIEKKNEILKTKIDTIVDYVNYQDLLSEQNIKSSVKQKAEKAYITAEKIYDKYKNIESQRELKKTIKKYIRPFNWGMDKNYIEILDFNGTLILAPEHMKKLENRSLLNYKDISGKYITKQEISTVKNGAGYILNNFEILNTQKNRQQIIYVKAFNHFGWYFKSAIYTDDRYINETKAIMGAVKKAKKIDNNYIFIFDHDGNILLNAAKKEDEGKNIYKLEKGFIKTYKKIIHFVTQNNSGFITYRWTNPKNNKFDLKYSYVSIIKNTEWIIGSGYYKKDVDKIVKAHIKKIDKEYVKQSSNLIQLAIITLLIFIILSYILSRYIKESFANYKKSLSQKNEELILANKKLTQNIKQLKETQDMLIESEKLASLGSLVAGVSHEINTPIGIALTGISSIQYKTNTLNELYKKEELTEENLAEYIRFTKTLSTNIHSSLTNAIRLIKSFKHISVDQHSDEKREINLKRYFDEIALNLKNPLKHKKIVIKNSIDEKIKLNTYAGIYSQIFSNLILNSIRHAFHKADPNNEIEVYTILKNNILEIHFRDNGIGIEKEFKKKIFDPFFTTSRGQGGSGLGLSIVHSLITKKLNGTIKIVDIKHGLHISFLVPIKEDG